MNTNELFASQWQSLKEKEQKLIAEAEQFKRKLNSLTEEPAMRQLLKEKEQHRKKLFELKDTVEMHKSTISGRLRALERYRLSKTDKKLGLEFAERLRKRKDRLARFKKMPNVPQMFIESEKRMIFEVSAPAEEVGKFYEEENRRDEQEQQAAQQILDETLARITAIKDHYRQARHFLEEAVRENERGRQESRTQRVQWAAQSRSHLEWILQHEPSYKDDAVRQYRSQFPSEDLSDLFPPPIVPTPPSTPNTNGKRHRLQSEPSLTTTENVPTITTELWRFWVTFNHNEPGHELPSEKGQFLSTLQSVLDKVGYRSLDIELVYDKLFSFSRMSLQQRQSMKKILGAEPLGWKILRVGRRHRLFLLVDEENRHTRFLPCPRDKSYLQH